MKVSQRDLAHTGYNCMEHYLYRTVLQGPGEFLVECLISQIMSYTMYLVKIYLVFFHCYIETKYKSCIMGNKVIIIHNYCV